MSQSAAFWGAEASSSSDAVVVQAMLALPQPLVVWEVDPSGPASDVVVAANAAARLWCGRTPDQLVGMPLSELFDRDVAEVMHGHLVHALRRAPMGFGDWSEHVFRPGEASDRVWSPSITRIDARHVVLLLHDVSQRTANRRQLRRTSEFDELTGLVRREAGLRDLDALLAHAGSRSQRAAVAYVDLDGFKDVNDTYGHRAGDVVLTEVARRVRSTVRAQDLVVRLGGDELLVGLAGVQSLDDAVRVADKLVAVVGEPIHDGAEVLHVTASIGVTLIEGDDTVPDLVARADGAMFSAKTTGRNRTCSV